MKASAIKLRTVCVSMGTNTNTVLCKKRNLPNSFNRRSMSCRSCMRNWTNSLRLRNWGRPLIYLITALRSAHTWLSIVKQDLESDFRTAVVSKWYLAKKGKITANNRAAISSQLPRSQAFWTIRSRAVAERELGAAAGPARISRRWLRDMAEPKSMIDPELSAEYDYNFLITFGGYSCIPSRRLLYQTRNKRAQGMGTLHPVLHGFKRQHGLPGPLPLRQGKPRGLRQATRWNPKSQDGRRGHFGRQCRLRVP